MTAGVPLNLNGTVYVLKAELTAIVSDGDGHRQSLQWRGASSLRPCFRHDNVMKLGSPVVHADDSFCDISCSEYRRFHTASPNDLVADRATLLDAERRHAAGALTPAALEQTRKEVGYNTTESGLLSDAELNADSDAHRKSLYDWAHTLFQDGVFTTEMNLFLDACHEKLRKKKNEFEIYLKGEYCFPKSTQTGMRQIHRIFSQARSPKNVVKGLMSECLSMYPMARHYIETVATEGEIDLERKSFLALCHVIDVLLSAKYGSITMVNGATLLRDAVVLYFEAHTSAYGRDHFKPKTHWLFDIADQMAELAARGVAVLPDCFAIERLHQASKHVAQHVTTRGGVKFSKLALTGVRSAFIQIKMHEQNVNQKHVHVIVQTQTNSTRSKSINQRHVDAPARLLEKLRCCTATQECSHGRRLTVWRSGHGAWSCSHNWRRGAFWRRCGYSRRWRLYGH